MDVTRNDLLDLLLSMDIKLPPRTKLPEAELEKRLSKALDAVQYLSRVVPSTPFNPSTHPAWNKSIKTADAVTRHTFGEASIVYESKLRGVDDPFPLYENPFTDLRQTLMHMTKAWDEGRDTFIFKDKGGIYVFTPDATYILIPLPIFHRKVSRTLR